ncbi:MAG: hypothetical protein V7746_01825 [Halioglobus sp.]
MKNIISFGIYPIGSVFFSRFCIALLSSVLLGYGPSLAAQSDACPPRPTPGNGQLCSAKDFTVTGILINGPDECTAGETIALEFIVGLESTANSRWDIGIFVGNDGGEVFDGASCDLTALVPQTNQDALFNGDDPAGLGPFRELDGDACGDIQNSDGINYRYVRVDSILCADRDGDGDVDISGLVTWSVNATQDVCDDPADPSSFFPDNSSKCDYSPNIRLPIVVEPLPSMDLVKTALPAALAAPGGAVEFFVKVLNSSSETDTLTIESLVDDIHGDLNGRGTCSVPQTVIPGASYRCTFSATVNGSEGYIETDTVTATAVDNEGTALNASDKATVTITAPGVAPPPSIAVAKSVYPQEIAEPGGTAIYSLRVANTSATEQVQINTITDDLYGDVFALGTCAATPPVTLAPGESTICFFFAAVPPAAQAPGEPGDNITDTITVAGVGVTSNEPVSDSDTATVVITDIPSSIRAAKFGIPRARPVPGGVFTFALVVQNTSPVDTVTLTTLTDDVYGDLNGRGTCSVPQTLAPNGDLYSCSFTGDFTGSEGDFQVDTISVIGTDDDGREVSAFPRAQVNISPIGAAPVPVLNVQKTASPVAVVEPGGPVTFTVEVFNASTISVITVNSLVDIPFGDLNGRGDCAVGAVLAPGDSYSCSFTQDVMGLGGDQIVDVVTAAGQSATGVSVEASDDAVVTILDTDIGPGGGDILVIKTAAPNVVKAPGAPVEFTVEVRNNSVVSALQLTALVDDVFGDLNGKGDCAVGGMIPARTSYTCRFTERVGGPGPGLHIDTVVAQGRTPGGDVLQDSDRALVFIRRVIDSVATAVTAVPVAPIWLWIGAFGLAVLAVRVLRR